MAGKGLSNDVAAPPMRRLVRHLDSHTYFKSGTWTDDPDQADSFGDVVEVAQACVRYDLSNVEMELRYPSGINFFSLPLR